jgi:hypothetical protein
MVLSHTRFRQPDRSRSPPEQGFQAGEAFEAKFGLPDKSAIAPSR